MILALLLAAPAAAQDLSVDPATVRSCYEETGPGETRPLCLGYAANDCQKAKGGMTTTGIVTCIAAETEVWDDILNEEYGAARETFAAREVASAPLDLTDALRDAQRAWIAFRDAECALAYAVWQDGTMRSIAGADCRMTLTAARAVELRDYRREPM